MDKNYYEILEIDKKASPEMIKKAYSTLAKKYHPDLQPDNLKANYEEKLKLINEAYEILSDQEKRKKYDMDLQILENKNQEVVDNLINENNILKNKLNNINNLYTNTSNINKNDIYNNQNNYIKFNNTINPNSQIQENMHTNNYENQILYQQELEKARQKAYHDAYIQDLRNRGYKIRYKKTLKDRLVGLASIFITVLILFLICQIPFVRTLFLKIDGLNIIVKFFDNLF